MITYSFLSVVCAAAHSGQVVCEEALALHVLRNWEEKLGEELGEAGGGGQERRGTLLSERHGQQATIGATASHIGQFGCACMGTGCCWWLSITLGCQRTTIDMGLQGHCMLPQSRERSALPHSEREVHFLTQTSPFRFKGYSETFTMVQVLPRHLSNRR